MWDIQLQRSPNSSKTRLENADHGYRKGMLEQALMPTGYATKMAYDVGKTLTMVCDASMSRKGKRAARPHVYW